MRRVRRTILLLLFLIAAACSSKAVKPTPTPKPTQTSSTRINVDINSAERTLPRRPNTRVVKRVTGDMDGDGIPEIAVWSEATTAPPGSLLRQDYVDVYSFRSTAFVKVFTASEALTVEPKNVGQHIEFFGFVTFTDKPDLVLGVLNEGAGAGPLDVWVWSWGTPFTQEFRYSTTVDGNLAVRGNQLTLTTGSYKSSDPMCCPSGMSHIVIGSKHGKIAVVSETTTKS